MDTPIMNDVHRASRWQLGACGCRRTSSTGHGALTIASPKVRREATWEAPTTWTLARVSHRRRRRAYRLWCTTQSLRTQILAAKQQVAMSSTSGLLLALCRPMPELRHIMLQQRQRLLPRSKATGNIF